MDADPRDHRGGSGDLSRRLGLVLAAGDSRRMGSPKALVDWQGETLLERAVRLLRAAAGVSEVIVVWGSAGDSIQEAVQLPDPTRWVQNPQPSRGQSSSVREGARALPVGAELVLLPVDHAAVEEETVRQLAAAFDGRAAGVAIVVPSFDRRRGHPVFLDAVAAAELAQLADGEAAHEVVRRDPLRVQHVEVDDVAVRLDLDRPEDLQRLRALREGSK